MKKVNKKLSLNKSVVTKLNNVIGGVEDGFSVFNWCNTYNNAATCKKKTIDDPSCAVTCTQMTMCRPCQA